MSTILLSIGSNTFAKTNIDKAKRMLSYLFPDIVFSPPILSEPEDDNFKYLFRNILASFRTQMAPEEIIDKIKQTERAVGRTPRDKYQGKVIIDIDLIKYGDEVLRPLDLEKEYIQQLLVIFEIPEVTETEELPDVTKAAETPEASNATEAAETGEATEVADAASGEDEKEDKVSK